MDFIWGMLLGLVVGFLLGCIDVEVSVETGRRGPDADV